MSIMLGSRAGWTSKSHMAWHFRTLKISPCLLFKRFVILLLDSNLESTVTEVPIKLFCVARTRVVIGRHVNVLSAYTLERKCSDNDAHREWMKNKPGGRWQTKGCKEKKKSYWLHKLTSLSLAKVKHASLDHQGSFCFLPRGLFKFTLVWIAFKDKRVVGIFFCYYF